MSKLGIIIPYRNRESQLETFIPFMQNYLNVKGIDDYVIIVSEQSRGQKFNRGALLNIGFVEAKKLGCDYVAFHDVDMLPIDVDYSYSEIPIQLANIFEDMSGNPIKDSNPYNYFGGVTLFPVDIFEKINGYDNEFWGWGYEDDDLLLRCETNNIPLKDIKYVQSPYKGKAIGFNGKTSFLQIKNTCKFSTSCLIYVDFIPDRIPVNVTQAHDESSIFSIPGLDIALSRESFGTYKFEFFDNKNDCYSIHTNNYPLLHCQAVIYYDASRKDVTFILNGKVIGRSIIIPGRKIKLHSKYMNIGVADPNRKEYTKFFKGSLINLTVVGRFATSDMVRSVLTRGIESLDPDFITTQIDATNYVDGIDCTLVDIDEPDYKNVKAGHTRPGKFKLQSYRGNKANKGYWKDWNTRLNQIRFEEHALTGPVEEGLSTLEGKFTWTVEQEEGKVYRVKVII